MRGAWFDEYERLWNEGDGEEPNLSDVDEAVAERFAAAADRAKDARKYGEAF